MSKEIINNEVIENVNEEEVMETETKQKFGTKFVAGVKKHGKKVVAGAAVIGVGLLGYVLGQKSAGGCEEGCCEDCDLDFGEDVSVEVDPE